MINSVCLIGNLASDPEIRSTPSGIKVAKMRIAVNEYWTNRQTGERNERTHWFALNAWDRMADTCERYLRKGQKIAIRGSLEYQEWSTPDGTKRSRIEIRVKEMEMLAPRENKRTDAGSMAQSEYSNSGYQKPGISGNLERSDSSAVYSDESGDDFMPIADEDIPF